MKRMIGVVAVLLIAAPAWAQNAAPARPRGYLAVSEIPDMVKIVPPAPAPGDARDINDRAVFRATRVFEGTPRWALSVSDDDVSAAGLLRAFSCAVGAEIGSQNTPRLAEVVSRVAIDGNAGLNVVKTLYQRKRPFDMDEGSICVPRTSPALRTPDYPSGHATVSWTVGLVLAEIVPDRAAEILVRARAFGESRMICGAHNASSIEASRTAGAAVAAALHNSATFRNDLEAAKTELAAKRPPAFSGSDVCKAEASTIAVNPYTVR